MGSYLIFLYYFNKHNLYNENTHTHTHTHTHRHTHKRPAALLKRDSNTGVFL